MEGGRSRNPQAFHVEAGQVLHGVLGIVDVLVHNKSLSAGPSLVTQPDLPNSTVLPKDIVKLLRCDLEGEVSGVNGNQRKWTGMSQAQVANSTHKINQATRKIWKT